MVPARRSVLGAGLAAMAVAVTGCGDQPRKAAPPATPFAPATRSPSPTGGPATTTPPVTPTPADYGPRLTAALTRHLKPTRENPQHPTFPGAVALVRQHGAVVGHVALGDAVRYEAGPVELPPARRVPMRPDAIFDLASITKVFTALLVLQLVDRGRVGLAAPVVDYLPEFDGPGRRPITVAMLLTHTSGLTEGAKVTGLPGPAERRAAVLASPLVDTPGRAYRYSSVGVQVLGHLVEKVTGQPLDQALRAGVTGPLGLRDTGFLPLGWAGRDRLVATDARSSRGLLRGVVHDDVANILGGVAGHAGVFSTAADLGVVGQALLDGGQYNGKRILSEGTVRRMLTNANAGLPAVDDVHPNRLSSHGLGVVLDQSWFMGKLCAPTTFGHTGFTGTSLVVSPSRQLVLVLLTNRSHPNWSWSDPDPARLDAAAAVAG
ncbi:serine hydrolase domain-containing protein [Longispora sp. K20-0274]|uniref:serine hydrolase domain-containing protein n=1 Tax=Longispora sp. K20-0274 TaxID=3088255 RepID=UPI003999561B